MNTAVIYARQSSGSDDHSESVELQIRNCTALARREHLTVLAVCRDLNVSGKTYPSGYEEIARNDRAFQSWYAAQSGHKRYREGLGRVFHMLPEIDNIIVDEITRLYRPVTRSFLEAFVNQALIDHRVQILQVKGGALDLAQFDQHLVVMLKNQINDEQIAKQRLKSIEALTRLRDHGVMPTGVTAWGLVYHKDTKKITVDPQKSAVIEYVFNAICDCVPYNQITQTVNARWGELFPTCFWEKSVYLIARKPIYAGYQFDSAGTLIKNRQWDGVIPLEQWKQAQIIMNGRKLATGRPRKCDDGGGNKHWLPLSGLIHCGHCGSRLVVGVDGKRVYYYCKRGYLDNDPACRAAKITASLNTPELLGLQEAVSVFFQLALNARRTALLTRRERARQQERLRAQIARYHEKLAQIALHFAENGLSEAHCRTATAAIAAKIRLLNARLDGVSVEYDDATENERLNEIAKKIARFQFVPAWYEPLLRDSIVKISAHESVIRVHTVDQRVFELPRKCWKRRKGLARREILKLRRELRPATPPPPAAADDGDKPGTAVVS